MASTAYTISPNTYFFSFLHCTSMVYKVDNEHLALSHQHLSIAVTVTLLKKVWLLFSSI